MIEFLFKWSIYWLEVVKLLSNIFNPLINILVDESLVNFFELLSSLLIFIKVLELELLLKLILFDKLLFNKYLVTILSLLVCKSLINFFRLLSSISVFYFYIFFNFNKSIWLFMKSFVLLSMFFWVIIEESEDSDCMLFRD